MTVPTYVFPLIGVPVAGFGLWKLLHRKPHVQSLTVGDDDGNTATVAVPANDDDPQASVSSVPPTSDDVSQVVTEDDVPPNVVAEPDGRGGYVHRHHRRRYIPPPITPGLIPLAPQVQTPYGVAPFAIRSPQDVQYGLNALGYGPLKVDGRVGPITHASIVEFQRRNNLPTIGYSPALHSHIQNAIVRAVPRITSPGARPIITGTTPQGVPVVRATATLPHQLPRTGIAYGDCAIGAEAVVATATAATPPAIAKKTGIKVLTPAHVQHALNKAGATPPLKVDGKLGPKTVAATKAFQISAGLVADGVPGPKTRTALAVACAPAPICIPCTCPVPTPVSWPDEPVLEGRNELFKGWAETHHLGSRVDCSRYEFGLEGEMGTNPAASVGFRGGHLPFGVEGPTGTGPQASAYFKHAHLPFGSEPQSCAPPHTPYYGASFKCAHSPFGYSGGHGHGGGTRPSAPMPPTSGVPTGAVMPTHAPPPTPSAPIVSAPIAPPSFSRPSAPSFSSSYSSPSTPAMLPTGSPGNYGVASYGSGPAMLPTWSPPSQGGYGGAAGYVSGYGGMTSGGFFGESPFEETLADPSVTYGTHQFGASGIRTTKKRVPKPPVGPTRLWSRKK
jgi:peptidoglycan hydrolase-like protein with peptidoglycan-binding domain